MPSPSESNKAEIINYSTHCPYCDSEEIEMIGDPEYNDEWHCEDCDKTFGSFVQKEETLESPQPTKKPIDHNHQIGLNFEGKQCPACWANATAAFPSLESPQPTKDLHLEWYGHDCERCKATAALPPAESPDLKETPDANPAKLPYTEELHRILAPLAMSTLSPNYFNALEQLESLITRAQVDALEHAKAANIKDWITIEEMNSLLESRILELNQENNES